MQRALLKRQAQAQGQGLALVNTSDISEKVAGDVAAMQSQFMDIGLARKARMERARQFDRTMKFDEKIQRDQRDELPWRIGLGLATSGLAGWQGMQRQKALRESAERQEARNAMIEDLIRRPEYKKRKDRMTGLPVSMNAQYPQVKKRYTWRNP
jgi:hypothetical protein